MSYTRHPKIAFFKKTVVIKSKWSEIKMRNVAKSKENLKKCRCIKCPSYTFACKVKAVPQGIVDMLKQDISEVEHMEGMFCAFGKSNCITDEKGCVCPTCEVYKENELDKSYYCLVLNGK